MPSWFAHHVLIIQPCTCGLVSNPAKPEDWEEFATPEHLGFEWISAAGAHGDPAAPCEALQAMLRSYHDVGAETEIDRIFEDAIAKLALRHDQPLTADQVEHLAGEVAPRMAAWMAWAALRGRACRRGDAIDHRQDRCELHMNIIQQALEEVFAKAWASGEIEESRLEAVKAETIPVVVPQLAAMLLKTLKKDAPRMLKEYRAIDTGFRRRNLARWRGAVDLLEMMWVISMEIGEEFINEAQGRPHSHKTDALIQLHARALLVTREIICLVHGGFADGALSRWRSLHEVAVTAFFLSQQREDIAERYLASFYFSRLRAAEQLNLHAGRANLIPFDDAEIAEMRRECDALAARFGPNMRKDYGWAAPVVLDLSFAGIEKAAQLNHWRPRYRWASQHTHSGHRPQMAMLGLAENIEPVYLVGASNSGFTDPLQMTGISLQIATQAMLLSTQKLDYLVVAQILGDLADEIGSVAMALEEKTLKAARAGSPRPKRHEEAEA